MGLDMYLLRKTYVLNWDHMRPEELHEITVKRGGVVRGDIKPERICYITEEVAYWRKANQIHAWFVENVQDGKDDCAEYWVTHDQLKELVRLCKQVLAACETLEGKVVNGIEFSKEGFKPILQDGKVMSDSSRAVAASTLPTAAGFFFGSTDYDEFYIEELQDTVEMLEPLLAEGGDGSLYYRSSW